MRKFILLAGLALVALLPLTLGAWAAPVPCGDACVVDPAFAPNVTLPGGIPGYELNSIGLTDHTVGPNVLIGLYPPGSSTLPADQSLILDGPTGALTNSSPSCPGGCSRFTLFFGLSGDPTFAFPSEDAILQSLGGSGIIIATHPPNPCLTDPLHPPGPCVPMNLGLSISDQLGSGLAMDSVGVQDLGSDLAGFPDFSAFTLTFDLHSAASPTLNFSLSDGQSFAFAPAPIPEPATLILVGSALVGLGVCRRRSKFDTSPVDALHRG